MAAFFRGWTFTKICRFVKARVKFPFPLRLSDHANYQTNAFGVGPHHLPDTAIACCDVVVRLDGLPKYHQHAGLADGKLIDVVAAFTGSRRRAPVPHSGDVRAQHFRGSDTGAPATNRLLQSQHQLRFIVNIWITGQQLRPHLGTADRCQFRIQRPHARCDRFDGEQFAVCNFDRFSNKLWRSPNRLGGRRDQQHKSAPHPGPQPERSVAAPSGRDASDRLDQRTLSSRLCPPTKSPTESQFVSGTTALPATRQPI